MKECLNFVYDNWDTDSQRPYNNCIIQNDQEEYNFNQDIGLIDFYRHFFYTQLGYEYGYLSVNFCKISDVYKNPNANFYYFFKSRIDIFFTLQNEKFKIKDETLKCFKECTNIFFVFLNEHEADSKQSAISLMEKIKELGLREEQFFVLNNNSNLIDYNNKLNTKINFYKLNFIALSSGPTLTYFDTKFETEKKGKFFLCHNRTPKPHRYALLSLLKHNNILDNVNWSLVPSYQRIMTDYRIYEYLLTKEDIEILKPEIEYFDSIDYKFSDFEINKNIIGADNDFDKTKLPKLIGVAGCGGGMMVPEIHETLINSYVNLVTESHFNDEVDVVHISEKSLRPFAFYQIPLILATFNHIQRMKNEFGFDFYEDLIDLSYDKEPNEKERLKLYMNEVIRLNNNKEMVIEYYKNNRERFEKNREIVCNIPNNDKDFKFLKSLTKNKF